MTKWEYKIVTISASRWTASGLPEETGQHFDELGEEGWELVRVEPILRGGYFFLGSGVGTSTESFVAFFRRPKA